MRSQTFHFISLLQRGNGSVGVRHEGRVNGFSVQEKMVGGG